MVKLILGVFGALILAVVAWSEASPLYALNEMRKAAAEGNGAKVSNYVDYEKLKIDLKGDLRRAILLEAGRKGADHDPWVKYGGDLAVAFSGPGVDMLVGPEAVQAMFDGLGAARAVADGAAPEPGSPMRPIPVAIPKDGAVIERTGFSEFKVRKPGKDGAAVFRRYGWSWKLVGVDMPYGFGAKK